MLYTVNTSRRFFLFLGCPRMASQFSTYFAAMQTYIQWSDIPKPMKAGLPKIMWPVKIFGLVRPCGAGLGPDKFYLDKFRFEVCK